MLCLFQNLECEILSKKKISRFSVILRRFCFFYLFKKKIPLIFDTIFIRANSKMCFSTLQALNQLAIVLLKTSGLT
ncbi:hypothetical protein C5473_21990 [Leptospira interrogans serovar Weerasinghe]|nr:hypothetical protein C5473_21990 [Leptospira interrogans serovar Weerasinghe]